MGRSLAAIRHHTASVKHHTASVKHIALIGNALPRRCGIATFTTDTYEALASNFPELIVDFYAMDDGSDVSYPAHVHPIAEKDSAAYREAAHRIATSGAEAIWLQHEFGIFGGAAGEMILGLLNRTTLPLLVTLHTVLESPSVNERAVIDALARRATGIVVMADKGREILTRVYGVSEKLISVIPHGVPDRPYVAPATMKPRFGFAEKHVLLTFGLLAPGKGIEHMIEAMPRIVRAHPDALYVVLGATHPHLVRDEGEDYRRRLETLAHTLGVSEHVRFVDAFVEQAEVLDYLQAADIYVTPYLNPQQATSGTLSYAVSLGKPVIATPYVHATEILSEDHGVIVDFRDSEGMAREIVRLLDDDEARDMLSLRAYTRGRTMLWSRLAERAVAILSEMRNAAPSPLVAPRPDAARLQPTLAAVLRMSDATGILQHGIYSVADRRHGYCVDDNARALILMSRIDGVDEELRDRWTSIYAAFVQHAWNPDNGRFRNFMRFDRSWTEDAGSEDSCGRSLWSLGITAAHARHQKHRDWASALFDRAAGSALSLGAPRAGAFAMLGAAAMIKAHPRHTLAHGIVEKFAGELLSLLEVSRRPDWPWFETMLAYDNARLPEALIRGGMALGREDMIACGLTTLDWIITQQTAPEGHFRAVGTDSFGRSYSPPLPFDQQPLEAQATIEACEAAYLASRDRKWVNEAHKAYQWYLGQNDLAMPLASQEDGGCFDGLQPTGINRNQGAESILALQLASVAISRLSLAVPGVAESVHAAA